MEIIDFDNIYEVGEFVYDYVDSYKETVAVVLFREDVIELFKYIEAEYVVDWGRVEILDEDYNKEYYLALSPEGIIEIIPVYCDEKQVIMPADVIFYGGDVSSSIVATNKNVDGYVLEIADDDCDDYSVCDCEDCSNCKISVSDDLKITLADLLKILNSLFKS